MMHIVQQFTWELRRVLIQAAQLAAFEKKKKIEPLHLFYSITNQAESILTNLSGHKKHVQKKSPDSLALSQSSQQLLLDAAAIAQEYNHHHIGTEHLFMSLLDSENEKITSLLRKSHVSHKELKKQLVSVLQSSTKLSEMLDSLFGATQEEKEQTDGTHPHTHQKTKNVSALEYFAIHLTEPSYAQKLDACIGREKELERIIHILSRRAKNNPILLGHPGVGKTALVEGLAKKIVEGTVPPILKNKRLYSLNITSLVAGSAWRGELEMRFKHLLDEVARDENVILFIDEIHTITGAGAAQGTLDVGNMLKPALARGELRCIGATTFQEYKKYIEEDGALERRFQPIHVEQPTAREACEILQGLAPQYESFHHVRIPNETLAATVQLSERYIPEKFLPDKAIDLLDEACAKVKVHYSSKTHKEKPKEVELIKNRLEQFLSVNKNPNDQALLNDQEFSTLLGEFRLQKEKDFPQEIPTVLPLHIAEIVSLSTGIPLTSLIQNEFEKLQSLETALSEKIVGHTVIKQRISKAIQRAKCGLTDPKRPLASFLFLGPSGVGKTELAKILAQEVCGPNSLIKLDMSEFSESFTISRLIGAPSGYIGYKEGGRLTESVRQRPYSLVLFDELEKAHPKIVHVLLQILEDGTLSDAAGKRVNFSNTIIVMTSNVGAEKFNSKTSLGFNTEKYSQQDIKHHVLGELKDTFSPELMSRINHVLLFDPLSSEDIQRIIQLQITEIGARLKERGITCSISSKARAQLGILVEEKGNGGRNVRHIIEEHIEPLLANAILEGKNKHHRSLSIDYKKNSFVCLPSKQ